MDRRTDRQTDTSDFTGPSVGRRSNNPVHVARHFQYKAEVFFKEIIIDSPLDKTEYYAISIEFKEICRPHVHSFIQIFNAAPNVENEVAYIELIEKSINAQLSDHSNNPRLFEIVKTYQAHAHSKTSWNYNKNECHFSYG